MDGFSEIILTNSITIHGTGLAVLSTAEAAARGEYVAECGDGVYRLLPSPHGHSWPAGAIAIIDSETTVRLAGYLKFRGAVIGEAKVGIVPRVVVEPELPVSVEVVGDQNDAVQPEGEIAGSSVASPVEAVPVKRRGRKSKNAVNS